MQRVEAAVLKEHDTSSTLRSTAADKEVTKTAMFGFPSEQAMAKFFGDPAYIEAKPDLTAFKGNFEKWIG